jgi:heat-inducible transcriptional repressor
MPDRPSLLADLNDRSREVFRRVVEAYIDSGDPVGSRTLSRTLSERISPATVRNVMQDLEFLGLLGSPHVSAGRVPTQLGLRLFVDSILEIGTVGARDRERIEATLGGSDADMSVLLERVGSALSGLTQGASIVFAPKHDAAIRHVEFLSLGPDRALVVLVTSDGHVENRVFTPPPGLTPSSMREAANFLSAMAQGRTLSELRQTMAGEIARRRQEIDELARALVERGLAHWEDAGERSERVIVRGHANLLDQAADAADFERIRVLFDDLERKRDIAEFLDLAEGGEGVRIFIGSENKLFSLSGSSLVVSPYMNADRRIIGAVGVIGPTRLNYGRVVPIVSYTAQRIGHLLADRSKG